MGWLMHVCFICSREAGGFIYIPPPLRATNSANHKSKKHFCSRNCQIIFSKSKKEKHMIDLTKAEKDSEEILCLIEVVVTAYQEAMQQREANSYEDLPCY